MKKTLSKLSLAIAGLAAFPMVAFAATETSSPSLDAAIAVGYWVSSIGLLIATIIMATAIATYGKSAIGSALTYITTGTAVLFAVTVFQKLGADFFGIADASVDIWWHVLFYVAILSYYFGMKTLVSMGSADPVAKPSSGKGWALFSLAAVVAVFLLPKAGEAIVTAYNASSLSSFGLHHFIAFALAGLVGAHLITAKKTLGQIGRAIANPMIVAIWALGLQHLWELLNESWKVVDVTSAQGEGGEKIFLTVAAICIIAAASRLKSFARA